MDHQHIKAKNIVVEGYSYEVCECGIALTSGEPMEKLIQ